MSHKQFLVKKVKERITNAKDDKLGDKNKSIEI
jgi:hypothetical protein